MKRSKPIVCSSIAALVVVCLGVPLLLLPTLRGHVIWDRDTPFAIYIVYIMPVLAAIASVLFMRWLHRPAFWLALVVEASVLAMVLLSYGALGWFLRLPFFSAADVRAIQSARVIRVCDSTDIVEISPAYLIHTRESHYGYGACPSARP